MAESRDAALKLRLLGGFSVSFGDCVVLDDAWPRSKARALIKFLALQPRRSAHRDVLVDMLWPTFDPAAAANNLRQTLHHLRSQLGAHGVPALVDAGRDEIALTVGVVIDIDEFRDRATQARAVRTDAGAYEHALEIYRGDLLPGDVYEDWTTRSRDELRELYVQLLLELAQLLEIHGDSDAAADRLRVLLVSEPAHEEAHRALMSLHALRGDRPRAIRQYEELRDALRQELDIEPDAATETLRRQIASGNVPRPPRVDRPPGVLVGRQTEVSQLKSALDDAFQQRSSVAIISGDPGVGKTRIAAELEAFAALRCASVAWGRCHEADGAPAFWPWTQALRALTDSTPTADLEQHLGGDAGEIARLVPELRERLPFVPEPHADASADARFELFESVASYLRRASAARPIVIILDDIHAADAPSLLLLQFVGRELQRARVLIAVTYRLHEVTSDMERTVAELGRDAAVGRQLALRGLSRQDVHRIVDVMAGGGISERLVDEIYRRSDGNALFVQEIVRQLIASGAESGVGDSPIPSTLRDAIRTRLARLSSSTNELLATASVLGRDFALDMLAAASGRSVSDCSHLLDAAVDEGVVLPGRDGGEFRFSHMLVTELLYADMPADARMRAHRIAGETLQHRKRHHPPEEVAAMAHHFYNASLGGECCENAVSALGEAAQLAMSRFAWEEAVRLNQRAIRVVERDPRIDPRLHCDALLALGESQEKSGLGEDAKESFRRAADLAQSIGYRAVETRAAIEYGTKLTFGDFGVPDDVLIQLLHRALDSWPPGDAAPLHARLLSRLAIALHYSPELTLREDLARRGERMSREVGDTATRAYCLHALHTALWTPAHMSERAAISSELLQLSAACGDPALLFQAHIWNFGNQLALGDPAGLDDGISSMCTIAEETRQPFYLWWSATVRANRFMMSGRLDEAERDAKQAAAAASGKSNPPPHLVEAVFGAMGFVMYPWQGRLPELSSAWVEMAKLFPGGRGAIALTDAESGRWLEAGRIMDELAAEDFPFPLDSNFLTAVAGVAKCAVLLDRRKDATLLYDRLLPYESLAVTLSDALYWSSVSHVLGLLARTTGQWKDAARHFEAALAAHERIGAYPQLAETQYEYAALLVMRARSAPDRKRASALLVQAAASAASIGMLALTRKIDELRQILPETTSLGG